MKLTKIHIDGYGRFVNTPFDLAPGLQIVAGANEHGKSTLRYFIGDMLYGQKRTTTKRIYEESNELRTPWGQAEAYGGRITYVLDNGHEIEVHRNFDRKKESLSVFNRTLGQDITHDFPTLKNRESTFAQTHLNMTKSVYLGTATISHLSLMELGDKEALVSIRERLLSLTDSGDESRSAEDAVQWLNNRTASIGQKTSRTKPLPMTRARLADLHAEYQQVFDSRQEIHVVERQHATVMEEIGVLLNEKTTLEHELKQSRDSEHSLRLNKARAFATEIDTCTRDSMALAQYREFPLENIGDVTLAHTQFAVAQEQLGRTESTLAEVEAQLSETLDRLADEGIVVMKEADPEFESDLSGFEAAIQSLNYRIDETKELHARCQTGYMDAQKILGDLPDFSQFATEPIERISQSTAAFDAACKVRDEEQAQWQHISELVEQKEFAIEAAKDLFADYDDFSALLDDHEVSSKNHADHLAELYPDSEDIKHEMDTQETRIPVLYGYTAFFMVALIVVMVVINTSGNATFYVPAALLGLLFSFTGGMTLLTRRQLARNQQRLSGTESEIERHERAAKKSTQQFDDLMEQTNSSTLREIEAVHEQYQNTLKEHDRIQEHLTLQSTRVEDSQAHVADLFAELEAMFTEIGGTLDSEEDVSAQAMKAIGRYHEYRDTKRHGLEHRDALNRYIEELESLELKRTALKTTERETALTVRQFLRDNHYPEEAQHDSALNALRAYRIRSAQARHQQSDLNVAQGQVKVLKQQQEEHAHTTQALRTSLETYFLAAGSDSFEEYQDKCSDAQRYQELRERRAALEEQLSDLLGEDTLAALQQRFSTVNVDASLSTRPSEAIQSELDANQATLENKRKREHALHILLAERNAGMRSLNEVEEERDATLKRQAQLELELHAADLAVRVMQEVTQKRHTKVAPQLAQLASQYLSTITDGAYSELLINQDMQISIRVPQTQTLNQDPERMLSKGTVDQIYLSLRLAMINTLSEGAEAIPMVLDDPFAHYDDARVQSAMKLMREVGNDRQVLLFTCREDVVRIAQSLGIPVLSI